MRSVKHVSLAALIVAITVTLGWLATSLIKAPFIYSVKAEFSVLPATDDQLVEWLMNQPGIVKAGVTRKDKTIIVYLILVRTISGHPDLPDISDGCARLGYGGQTGPFVK